MSDVQSIARSAKSASNALAYLATDAKNAILRDLAARLGSRADAIQAANEIDLAAGRASGLPDAKLRRLVLDRAGIAQMVTGLEQVVALPDPVGQTTRDYAVPSGIHVQRVRCPLGVVLMIYEARPNVTIDAFSLCFKAGNACILKGGREAAHTNAALADEIHAALRAGGAPETAMHLLTGSDREQMKELLRQSESIDLCIPRGGTELIRFVHENARVPTIQHFHGVCHIFVDQSADLDRAAPLCVRAKTSGPATCNAVEAILVHAAIADAFVPALVGAYRAAGVEVRGDERVCRLAGAAATAAEPDDWGREFLDLIVAVRVVAGLDEAIAHINRYGSHHTDAILSADPLAAKAFLERVQSSCTLLNASTRFNDGFQLGLGAEIGISTSRIHAYGPMGLEELTTQRFIVQGDYQMR